MNWRILHQYRFLASQGVCKVFDCLFCHSTNVELTLDDFDEPAVQCYECKNIISISMTRYDDMKAVVDEFYTEE